MPAETATATPEAGIDMEKFTNFPQSYDYLLDHLDEFVQAPDPVDDRAAFDRWFSEELVPALGPVSERARNVDGNFGFSRYTFEFSNTNKNEITGPIHSFYFVNHGIVFFVPCIHITQESKYPVDRNMTVCVVLFDLPSHHGNSDIEQIADGGKFYYGTMYFNPGIDMPDVDFANVDALIMSIGQYPFEGHRVMFGFGFLTVVP